MAKCLAKQSLGTISLNGVANGLARSCDAESMMLQAIRTYESSHQRTIITLTMSINPAKIVRGAQM